jgi:endonuclease/exonuclease/phosphatase family metal-dependent hydrolase
MRGIMRLWVLSRFPIESVEYHRWGDVRNLVTCILKDPSNGKRLRIIAVHLDDRSETARQKQLAEIIPYINSSDIPTVMLGDFNAMWRRGRARILQSWLVRFVASILPDKELRQVATHLTDMATGSILGDIASKTNLQPADTRFQSTITPKRRGMLFMPSVRLAQIDHILVSPTIHVDSFRVGHDGGSDHRSISAELTIK